MSLTNSPDYVRYACTCGSLKPITKMYFCRHCLKVRCGYCVCHEVDSHYCTNCMENIPSSEARLKKNKCANCFDCPSCFHTLSFRTTTGIRIAEDGTKSTGKVYYLACLYCRWTSRDVGIPDQTIAERDVLEEEIETASLKLLDQLQNQEFDDGSVEVALNNIVKILPGSLTPQIISSNSFCGYNFVTKCYSRLLSELCKLLDNKTIRRNERAMSAVKNIFVIDSASVSMFNESLTVLLSEFKQTEGPSEKLDIIIGLLESFIKSNCLQSAVLSVCKPSVEDSVVQGLVRNQWTSSVQILVSLPNYVSNKLGKNMPNCFIPETFTKIIAGHIVKSILYLGEIKRIDVEVDVKPLSMLFSKLVVNYKSYSFIKHLLQIIDSWCRQRDVLFSKIVQNVMLKLDQRSIETVSIHVLKNCCQLSVFRILNYCVLKSENWNYVLCHKLPLLMYSNDDNILINLVTYLGNVHKCFQTDEEFETKAASILTGFLTSLISIWSDQFALVHTPLEQHLYITKVIVLAVKYITENRKELNIDSGFISLIKSKFFSGVPVHLDSSVEAVRAIGMIASELFVGYINTAIEDKDKFDLKFDFGKLKGESLAVVESVKRVVRLEHEHECLGEEDGDDLLYEMLTECGVLKIDEKLEVVNQDVPLIKQVKNYENLNSAITNDEDDEDELDSDDDFEPYDTSNDTKLAVKKQPSYLRDLIEGFREDKDADIWVGSLEVCENLIYKQLPHDDVSLGLEILDILIGLDKTFYCENFEVLKFTSALAVVIVNPQQSAEFLCSKFHEDLRRYSIAHRMLMLDLLSGGARILSGLSKEEPLDKKMELLSLRTRLNYVPQWEAVVRERIESNTKRFFKPRNAPVISKNKFSKVAGSFLFPLLRGSRKTSQVISFQVNSVDNFKNDPHMLLVHFLQTCTIIMVSSVNCPIILRMAKELLEATWNLRFHTESKVREAVIGCIASVVLSLPSYQLYSDLWDEISEAKIWLSSIASSEGIIGGKLCEVDVKCRAFAAQVVLLISDALDKTKDFAV